MMTIETKQTVKECRECGGQFIEKQESSLYECEHCIGRYEE
ncbi:YhfH family protein [Cytobacillus sp. Hz8]